MQYVFAQYGIAVPRVVEQQYEVGDTIRPSEIKPGDLIFFNTKKRGDGASHVAIAIGQDSFVHAPNSTGVVRIETLGSAYWGARYVEPTYFTRRLALDSRLLTSASLPGSASFCALIGCYVIAAAPCAKLLHDLLAA